MALTFGALVKDRRMARGWSLTDLGERVGLDVGTMSRIETENTQATVVTAVRLCLGLGLSLADVVAAIDGEEVNDRGTASSVPATARAPDGDEAALTLPEVQALVRWSRATTEAAVVLFARLLNDIAGRLAMDQGATDASPPTLSSDLARTLLTPTPIGRFEIAYPASMPPATILDTYRAGGAMVRDDARAYLRHVRPDLPTLAKKPADVIQRIAIGQTERLRLADLLVLRASIGTHPEIVDMFWAAMCMEITLLGRALDGSEDDAGLRLGINTVTICRWLQTTMGADKEGIIALRHAAAQA